MDGSGRALLVCSGGGHLKQLNALAERIGIAPDQQHWVTFRNGLSESLLAGRTVDYAPFTAPRDGLNILRMRRMAHHLVRENDFSLALSTGSSPGVAFLPVTARHGIPSHYIESAARADGPSMSGRIIARHRGISTYTQYPVWSSERWLYRGSLFDAWEPGPALSPTGPIRRAVVTLGTQYGYPFDRLVAALVPLLADVDEVLWQVADVDVSGLGITAHDSVPHAELAAAVAAADVVIAHAGTGSAVTALEAGKLPILVPRLKVHREHVDDHQIQIARELQRRGLALVRTPDDLSTDDLHAARGRSVAAVVPPRFALTSHPAEMRTP